MYQKFKDCLLFPKNIYNYMDEPKKKTVGFFFIMLLILVIPALIMIFTAGSGIVIEPGTSVEKSGSINYKLEDNKLVATTEDATPGYIISDVELSSYSTAITSVVIFVGSDDLGASGLLNNNFSDALIYLSFGSEKIGVGMISSSVYGQANATASTGTQLLEIGYFTYEELNLTSLDFSILKSDPTKFNEQFAVVIESAIKNLKTSLMPLLIIFTIVDCAVDYLFTLLIVSLIELLFTRMLGIKFGKIFKAAILCSIPYVLSYVVYSLTGISFISLIGEILTIVYLNRALFNYRMIKGANGGPTIVNGEQKDRDESIRIMPGVYVHRKKDATPKDNPIDVDSEDASDDSYSSDTTDSNEDNLNQTSNDEDDDRGDNNEL